MLEIDIPSIDPIQHKPKIFFGMTARQCVCITPGVALGVSLFVLTYGISSTLAMCLTTLAVAPAVCLGWVRMYNMPFEEYVKLMYFNNFVANQKRLYKTSSAEVKKMMTMKEREEDEKKKKENEIKEKRKKKENKNKNKDKEEES